MNLKQKLTTALLTAVACFLLIPTAAADQVILDDLIVDGSACIGFDCVNGEVFGFDTIRLKENNVRIKFEDTSNSASFPSTDWQLTANDSSNGGANKFSIDDISGGKTPFTVEANAPNHSLYVDDGGRIGLGTSTPSVDIHVKDGDTPTLRLEQDGSSGFGTQTWDVAGNETNFFIRDASNGSQLPFRIRPSAPTNSIFIDTDGDIGMGTNSPAAALHVLDNSTTDLAVLETDELQAKLMLQNGMSTWDFSGGDPNFVISNVGSGVTELTLVKATGNLTIAGGLISSGGGGACTPADPCDGVFEPSFEIESIEEHAEFMWENNHLRAIGPTLEQGPIDITQKTGGLINELEKAHIYIERLNERLKEKESKLDDLTDRLARLESRLGAQASQSDDD